jgi:anti-anti-sigma factor
MIEESTFRMEDWNPLVIAHMSGSFSGIEVYKLKGMSDGFHREGRKYLVVDLAQVSFLDSAGIGVLLHLRNTWQNPDGRIAYVKPLAGNVMRSIEISAIMNLVPFFEDLNQALVYMHDKFGCPYDPVIPESPVDNLTSIFQALNLRLKQIEERLERLEANASHGMLN